jgi:hypothetical protein
MLGDARSAEFMGAVSQLRRFSAVQGSFFAKKCLRAEGTGLTFGELCPCKPRGDAMVTWVLTEEPTIEVARAIEVIEHRLGEDPDQVQWICAHLPASEVTEPIQD